jgi:hypothetical protein
MIWQTVKNQLEIIGHYCCKVTIKFTIFYDTFEMFGY